MSGLVLDANTVPTVYRVKVKENGKIVAMMSVHITPADVDKFKNKVAKEFAADPQFGEVEIEIYAA